MVLSRTAVQGFALLPLFGVSFGISQRSLLNSSDRASFCVWDEVFTRNWASTSLECRLNPKYVFGLELYKDTTPRISHYTTRERCFEDIDCGWSNDTRSCRFFLDSNSLGRQLACQGSPAHERITCFSLGYRGQCRDPCVEAISPTTRRLTCIPRWYNISDANFTEEFSGKVSTYSEEVFGRCLGQKLALQLLGNAPVCVTIKSSEVCSMARGCQWKKTGCLKSDIVYTLWTENFQDPSMKKLLEAKAICERLPQSECMEASFIVMEAPRPYDLSIPEGGDVRGTRLTAGAVAAVVAGGVFGVAAVVLLTIKWRASLHRPPQRGPTGPVQVGLRILKLAVGHPGNIPAGTENSM